MKFSTLFLLMFFCLLSINNLLAQEETENLNLTLESSAQSKYVWRGLTYNTGLIIQPAITASYKNIFAQVWGSYTANDVDDDIKRHEIEFIVWYDYEIESFTFSPSFVYYKFPGQDDAPSTVELGLDVSYSLDEFTLGTSFIKDVVESKGALSVALIAGYEPELTENISLRFTSEVGWANKSFNEYNVGIPKSTLNYFSLKGTFNYTINKTLSISPFVETYFIIDKEFRAALYNSVFNYGITFSLGL
ncbi:MAG TPA: hypothetical protein PKE38_04560 [Ignavibacteriaceae bacterium]|nr:hypothetical protein [Ignavibacteriaceae bacterium]